MSENETPKQYKKIKPKAPTGGGGKKGPNKPFNFYWIYAIIGVVLISLNLFNWSGSMANINLSEFERMVENEEVKRVVIYNKQMAEVYLKKEALNKEKHSKKMKKPLIGGAQSAGPHYKFDIGPADSLQEKLDKWNEEYELAYDYKTRSEWGKEIITWILFIGIMIAVWMFVMRRISGGGGAGGQLFNIGKSKAQLFDKTKGTNVTFNDVAGLEGAKEEIQEIVDFLKNPKRYTALGAKIPKGALLVGPPGTGKTLLAKAVAGEAQVPFFSLSGSDFVEMFVGVGASRVRDLFKQAKEKAPAIIFIDEIDAIGRARGKSASMGANDERENTLNQLLTEMDGFGTNSGVIIIAATNRADVLDRALLRAGRFDRQIYVDMPDLNERKEIFKVHLAPIKVDKSIDVDFLAKQTPGFSGADIANICNEAALIAARKKKKEVSKEDFLDAVDRIIGGLEKKNKIITKKEKETIAYHEAGHATVSWLLEHASPLVKVTIVPRGQSLGAAWYLPEERQLNTVRQIQDEMCAALGGRAAEQIIFDEISTGALSDLEKITKQAYAMVSIYGLNEAIGNISFYDSTGSSDYNFTKPYSDKTAELIDQEVKKIVSDQYERAKKILSDNKDKLAKLASQLLEKEVIFKEDLVTIFGKRPYEKEEPLAENANGEAKEKDEKLGAEKDVSSESKPEESKDEPESKEEQSEESSAVEKDSPTKN
ncbi:MAG TPA: ATP-dependent zinc metalloprotease FtsH [Cryomorphaceae bacterium]|nr:ATP-dependent zinc metalloprotease FtsH [Cryomorphaceae bacterium]